MPSAPTPKKRQTRTPAQKAQEALDVIDRQIVAVNKRIAAKKTELRDVEAELEPLRKRREYAALNPDLPPQTSERSAGFEPVADGDD